jgi:uroporphyrinogen decarboxylase
MTGKERVLAAVGRQETDRTPVFPITHYFTAGVKGVPISRFATDGDIMGSALIAGLERFGWDGINPGCDVAVEGEALGSTLDFPENAPPHVVVPVLSEPALLRTLKKPHPLRDGRMPVVIRATQICVREAGESIYIGPYTMGPFNCASQVRGVQELLMDTVERPDFVEELLDFCTEVVLDYGKALVDAGAHGVFLGEAICTPGMISPRFYQNCVLPRQQRLVKALKQYGAGQVLIHICGDVKKILPAMLETGADMFDLDWQVDMAEAKQTFAGKATVRGNLDPSAVLLKGKPEDVYENAARVIRSAGAGGGLILSSGCDVSPGTPYENLDAMMSAAKDTSPGSGV